MKKLVFLLLIFYISVYANDIFLYNQPDDNRTDKEVKVIDHGIFILQNNAHTKFADWVAYKLDTSIINGDSRVYRRWKKDPLLNSSETLSPNDYKGANKLLKTDRGHQAPLASFKGTEEWYKTNYLSNITPQKAALNQGPWKKIEDAVRKYINKHHTTLYILTGPLYDNSMLKLPGTDKEHTIPSGYWKIIAEKKEKKVQVISFIFDQNTQRSEDPSLYITTVDKVEELSGLNFFSGIDNEDSIENEISKYLLIK